MGKSIRIPGAVDSIGELAKMVLLKREGPKFYCAPWAYSEEEDCTVKTFTLTKHSFMRGHRLFQVLSPEGQWNGMEFSSSPFRLKRCHGNFDVGYYVFFENPRPIFTNYFLAYGHLLRYRNLKEEPHE